AEHPHGRKRRGRRYAEVMEPPTLAGERAFGFLDRLAECVRARVQGHVVEVCREGAPGLFRDFDLARGEFVDGLSGELAEPVRVELVQRDADDPVARDEPGARQMEETGEELASGKVAASPEEHDDVRETRAYAAGNLRL